MILANWKGVHLILDMFKNHLQAMLLPPLSMYAHTSGTHIAHYMFGQIKWGLRGTVVGVRPYLKKWDSKPWMISGQSFVACVGVHQLSVSPNTSHLMLQIRSKLLHGNSTPNLKSSYIRLTPTQQAQTVKRGQLVPVIRAKFQMGSFKLNFYQE
jgi:hypothetical protein